MSLRWYQGDIISEKEGLDPLLPHIVGIIENMDEASISVIHRELEKDLNERVSREVLVSALENGLKLGLFNMEREFKVCREFTSKAIRRVKNFGNTITLRKSPNRPETARGDKNLMEYVKMQREKRRRKMYKGRTGRQMMAGGFRGNNEIFSQLCQKCRRSVEKKLMRFRKKDSFDLSSEDEYSDERKSISYGPSSTEMSSASEISNPNSRSSENDRKQPRKSKLLVERNPMETDPPYYDIFT